MVIFALFLLCNAQKSGEKFCETAKDCEEDPNYPENLLNQLNLWQYSFDTNPINSRAKRSSDLDFDTYLIEQKLCKLNVALNRPQKLRNINGEIRTIVNHQNYTQVVRMETCVAESFPCTRNIYPQSVRSFCHQNYNVVSLLAFDDRKNCLVTEKFRVPSSCACAIDKEDFFQGVSKDLLQRP